MSARPDQAWLARLRYRLEDFRATAILGRHLACSIKLRPSRGHFDRASAPAAYALIDERVRGSLSARTWLGEHDTGPEILCAWGLPHAHKTLPAALPALLNQILGAAQQGRKAGDELDETLDLLLRGFDETGAYFEQAIMRIELEAPIEQASIRGAFEQGRIGFTNPKGERPERREAQIE